MYMDKTGHMTWKGVLPSHEIVRVKTLPPDSKLKRVSAFTVLWAAWFAFFLVLEGIALFRPERGDTFSENWWSLFRLQSRVPVWLRLILVVVQVGFGTWLTGHLAFGWWTIK